MILLLFFFFKWVLLFKIFSFFFSFLPLQAWQIKWEASLLQKTVRNGRHRGSSLVTSALGNFTVLRPWEVTKMLIRKREMQPRKPRKQIAESVLCSLLLHPSPILLLSLIPLLSTSNLTLPVMIILEFMTILDPVMAIWEPRTVSDLLVLQVSNPGTLIFLPMVERKSRGWTGKGDLEAAMDKGHRPLWTIIIWALILRWRIKRRSLISPYIYRNKKEMHLENKIGK